MEFVKMQKKNILSSLEIIHIPVLNDNKLLIGQDRVIKWTDLESGVKPTKLKEKRFKESWLGNILDIAVGIS